MSSIRGRINFWDSATGASRGAVAITRLLFTKMAYSPDGGFLAYAATHDKTNFTKSMLVGGVWDLELQAMRSVYDAESAFYTNIHYIAPNGELFAISANDYVRVVNTRSMCELRRIESIRARNISPAFRCREILTFSPTGKYLVVVEPKNVSICGVFTDRCITVPVEAVGGVFSPVENLFAFAALDCSVCFWHVDMNRKRTRLVMSPKYATWRFRPTANSSHTYAPRSV